jgi:hypothetical protein
VKAVNYSVLGLSGSGAKTMTGVTTIGSDFNMSGSATATTVITTVGGNVNISGTAVMTTGANLAITGSLNIGSGSGFTDGANFTLSAPTITVNGTFTNSSTGALTGNMTVGASTGILALGAVNVTLTGNLINNNSVTGTTAQLSVSGSVTNTGTIALSAGRIMQTGSSDFTNSGSITFTGAGRLYFSGNFTNTGTLTLASTQVRLVGTGSGSYNIDGFTTTGLVTVSAAAGTYTFTGNVSCAGITINGAAVTLNLGAGLTHTTTAALTITTGTLNGGSSTINLNLTGAAFTNAGTFTPASGTINYSFAGTQTGLATTYNNLTISGTGIKTFATTPTVNGILSMEGTTASIVATAGVVTYGTNATLQYNKTAAFTATTEEWISPFVATGGIIIKNSGAITLPGAVQIGSNAADVPLNINGGTLTPGANLITLYGDFINTGTLTSGSGGVTITGTIATQNIDAFTTTGNVILSKASGTATLSGNVSAANLTASGAGTFILSGSNTFSGTRTQSAGILSLANTAALGVSGTALNLNGGTLDLATDASVNAYNVTVGGTATIASDKATAASAGITHTLGTLSIGNFTLSTTVGSNVGSGTAGLTFGNITFTASTPTFDVATGANLTLGALQTNTFNFAKTNSGQLTLNTAANAARVAGSFTLTGGTAVLGSASALGTAATTLVLNGGTLDLRIDGSVNAHPTTVTATSTVVSNKATAASAGITHTLGTLSIGNFTLSTTVGSNVGSGTAGLTFGNITFTASTPTFDVATGANLTLGALQTNTFNFAKTNSGQLTLNTAANAARVAGSFILTGGTAVLGSASALGTTGTTLTLNGGTLDLAISSTVNAYPTTVSGDVIILSNTATAIAGITHALGTLSIGANILTINKGTNATGNTAAVSFSNMTMSGAPILNLGTANLLLTGTASGNFKLTKNGAGTLQKTTAGLSLGNDFEITAGIYDANGQTTTVTGLSTISGGEYQAKVALQTFNGGLTVSGGTFTGAAGNITTTDITLSTGTLTAPSGTFNVSGNWLKSGGTFTPGSNTVTFNGAGAQTINSGGSSFYNLTLSGSGTKTLLAEAAVTNAFTVSSGVTFDPGSFILSGAGTFTLSGTAIVPGVTFATNYTIAGIKTINAGSTFIYQNANPIIDASITYQNVSFTGAGTAGANGALTIQGDLTNTGGGTLDFGTNGLLLSGTVVTQSIAGFTTTGGLTVTKTSGVATMTSAMSPGALIMNGGGGTFNLGAGLLHIVTDVTLTNGILDGGSSTLNVSGAWTGTATFTASTGTVNFNAGGAQTLPTTSTTFNNLTLSTSGTKTFGSATIVNGALTINNGTTFNTSAANNYALTMNGNFVNSGTFIGNASDITIGGTATQSIDGFTTTGGLTVNKTSGVATMTSAMSPGTLTMNGGGGTLNLGTGLTHSVVGITFTNGTLNLGSSTMNVAGAVTLTTGTLDLGSGTMNLTGNFSGAGTFTCGTGTMNFNGNSVDQIVRGGITYYNLQISNGGSKLLQAGDATVSNMLTLNSGIFKINDFNLILTDPAAGAIAGSPYSISNMIQTGGIGYVQKAGAADGTGIDIVYPVGSGGYYNPLDLSSGFTATGPGNLQISATTANQGANALSKYWTLTVSGYTGIVTNLRFTYDNAEVHGVQSNYDTWYNSGSSWGLAPGTHTALGAKPFGTNVSGVSAASISGKWTAGASTPSSSNSFYSYQSGDWDDASSWTSDPSGQMWINTGIPANSDNVTILNGRTISISANTKRVASLTLILGGILDIKSTTGHNFGTITGQGKIMLSSISLPSGTYTNFVASNGGTIEYYNLNAVGLSTSQLIYNNLIISNYIGIASSTYLDNSTSPTYTVNGNFSLKNYSTGSNTFYFGNPTASDNLINMTVSGNFSIDAGCSIGVNNFAGVHNIPNVNDEGATPYPVHTLNLYGNFTNNGSVRFTGLPSPFNDAYYILTTTTYPWGGANNYGDVQVLFKGATNNTLTCNNTTDFFRIIVEKGTDKTYTLEVNSSSTNNFALYAPNNQGNDQFAGGTNGYGFGAYYKALFIHYGTLKLNENINIPSLTERGTDGGTYIGGQDFNLLQTAELWINGATVSTTKSGINGTGYQAATLYGILRISAGSFSTGDAAGLVLGDVGTPIITLEGAGTLDVSQLWSAGTTNRVTYEQKGGTAYFRATGEDHGGSAILGLSSPNSVFIMSGGTLNFTSYTFAGPNYNRAIIDIQSQVGNYNVIGGTINLNLPSSGPVLTVNSTVPFYNLTISNATGSGTTPIRWTTPGSSLTVLHDLSIGNLSSLDLNTNSIALTVGHDFTISSGGTFIPGTGLTTTFNGTGTQAFNNTGTITGTLQNIALTNTTDLTFNGNNITLTGDLAIGHGTTLRDNGTTISVQGNIVNSGTHFKPASGAGSIQLTGTAAQTISGDGTGSFNNLTLNKATGSINTTANFTITGELRLANNAPLLNIGSNLLALGVDANVYDAVAGTTQNFSAARMIYTNGQLSDGGVSKTFSNTNAFNFPFGFYNTSNTTYYYMPHSIQFSSAPTTYGTVTTRPVNARHPLTQSNNSLACYWKATSTGFTGVPAGSVFNNYYYDYAQTNYFVSGTEANYIPAVYSNSIWNTAPSGVNTGTNKVTYNSDNADGEYTAGESAAFGVIPTLYSVASGGPWNNVNTWSATRGGSGGAGIPGANTLVIICNSATVTTPVAASATSLTIESGSTLDLGIVTGHNFGSIPTCNGTLRIASTNYFPRGDWTNFLGTAGGTVEYYQISAGTLNLPTTYTLSGGGTANITGYYNLIASPYNTSSIILPNTNLTVYNNFIVGYSTGGGTSNCITQINVGASSTTLEVKGNINVNQYGVLQYMNNVAEYVIADNDINIASGGALQVVNSGNSVANTLTVYGNIVNNGTFDLDSNYPTNDNYNCSLNFTGSLSKSLSSTVTPTRTRLYNIGVNKGTSRDAVLDINIDPTGFTMGGGGLNLQNGTFRLTTNVTMPLSTGGFTIPGTACLSVNGGTYNIATGAAAADLALNGRLEVLAGSVNIGPALTAGSGNAFNIVYASAGTPEIIISGGSLNVYSQIRRGTGTTSGSLNYTQTSGTVTIGGKNPITSRAVFEVLNDGILTMSNGTLIIANHITAASPYDLYLDPGIEYVTGGTIQFGLSTSVTTSNTFYYQASCSIGNIILEATTNSSATQEIYELTLLGSLTISGTSSFYNANGLDITIGGNLTNNNTDASTGLNVGGYRTQLLTQSTGFVGTTDQTITGTASNLTNFADLDISTAGGHSLFLSSSNITVNGDLTLSTGTLNDGGNTITLLNNVDNNAAHYSTNSTSGGMIFNGTINQRITGSGSGVFGNIEINNVGHRINMTNNSTMNGQLKFTNGYLYIDNYALTLGQNATIVNANATNQITLNGMASDAGVTKIFPSGDQSFTYPIGANGKYTPCAFHFSSNTNPAGTIKVIPVDDLHPTLDPDGYTNYLNYYWNVTTTGFSPSTYNVAHTYTYIPADVTGSPANIERCDNSTSQWSTVTGTISSPTFSFSNSTLLDGSYTIGDVFGSLPTLYSTKSGNWNDATVWSPPQVPNGHSVVINSGHTVSLTVNGAIASSVVIDGVLDAQSTTSHSLGSVSGGGKLRLSASGASFVFPGGTYDAFLANSTSIVEYYGNTNSTMPLTPGDINKPYQHVLFSGTGIKYVSAVNIKINSTLTISDGSKLDNTLNNTELILLGNWVDQNTSTGGFTAGTGTVHFSGTTAQSIIMASNSIKETFYNLDINNTAGLIINTGTVDVSNQLMLTSGNINFTSISDNILTITNTGSNAVTGGSINSFVNGPLRKIIGNNSSFQFPVGDANSSSRNRIGYVSVSNTTSPGDQIWTARFYDKNPTADGYDVTKITQPLISAVNNEYWNIIGPSGGSAKVTLSWDQYTGMNSDLSKRASSAVAEWNTPVPSSWNNDGGVVVDGGQNSGTVTTSATVNLDSHIFTIGAKATLFTAAITGNWNDITTWGTTVLPSSNDAVEIANGITVTLNTTGVVITKLTVDDGGTFNNGNFTLNLTGNLELKSNSIWTGSGGKISMTGSSSTIFGSGVMTGTCTLEVAGNKNIDASANLTLTNVSILSGNTLTNNGTVTISSLSSGGTFENKNGSTLNFTGANLDAITLTANECNNTVVYSGTVAQAVKQTTYCNLTLSNSGLKTISVAGTTTANGNAIVNAGTQLDITGGQSTVFKINGNFENSGTVNAGGRIEN